jgi:acyl-CoA reductase-like NAD-dependent aldehyde dehydrogenase
MYSSWPALPRADSGNAAKSSLADPTNRTCFTCRHYTNIRILVNRVSSGAPTFDLPVDGRRCSMPFGGVKHSGLSREGVKFALQEMTEPKVVCFYLPRL